jgi:Tat protein translocase TatB subunit
MLNIGGGELLIIFLVALVVLGPGKLPEAARQAGQVMKEFRKISSGFQRELKTALDDPVGKAVTSATAAAAVAPTADVTSDAELPEIETPQADDAVSGDDPETRQARAESIATATPATPVVNAAADPFAAKETTLSSRPAPPDPAPTTMASASSDGVDSAADTAAAAVADVDVPDEGAPSDR